MPDAPSALRWLWILNPIFGPLGLAQRWFGLPSANWLPSRWVARLSIVWLGLFLIGEAYAGLLAARRETAQQAVRAARNGGRVAMGDAPPRHVADAAADADV